MSTDPSPQGYLKKETVIFTALITFAAGFLGGIVFSAYKTDGEQATKKISSQPAPADKAQQALLAMEREVQKNPDNMVAWVHLGNSYFDMNNFNKAIHAYNKALEINPQNANVLTDLGVMYRRNNQHQESLNAFNQAIVVDPTHPTARFNKGVVLYYDMKNKDMAIAEWQGLVKMNPMAKAPNGQLVSELITALQESE